MGMKEVDPSGEDLGGWKEEQRRDGRASLNSEIEIRFFHPWGGRTSDTLHTERHPSVEVKEKCSRVCFKEASVFVHFIFVLSMFTVTSLHNDNTLTVQRSTVLWSAIFILKSNNLRYGTVDTTAFLFYR